MTVDSGSLPGELSRALATPLSDRHIPDDNFTPPNVTQDGAGYDTRGRDASGKVVSAEVQRYRDMLAAGLVHVVAECRYGAGRYTLCSCGERFEGRTDDATAAAFNSHSAEFRKDRGAVARRLFGVERSGPVTSSFDTIEDPD